MVKISPTVGLNPFYIVELFSYKESNQKLKYDKNPRDVKFVLTNIMLYLFHKASTK